MNESITSYNGILFPVNLGCDWVAENGKRPAVASMSLGGGASETMDQAIRGMHNAGVPVVVAAGNSDYDACLYSPAREPLVSCRLSRGMHDTLLY